MSLRGIDDEIAERALEERALKALAEEELRRGPRQRSALVDESRWVRVLAMSRTGPGALLVFAQDGLLPPYWNVALLLSSYTPRIFFNELPTPGDMYVSRTARYTLRWFLTHSLEVVDSWQYTVALHAVPEHRFTWRIPVYWRES